MHRMVQRHRNSQLREDEEAWVQWSCHKLQVDLLSSSSDSHGSASDDLAVAQNRFGPILVVGLGCSLGVRISIKVLVLSMCQGSILGIYC